ncbi:response regulator transcription factor [Candidatus Kaiserbacteria bacterium]|nr:response regulator transcription factor [Candidatus Kaiserbacteria bacterium]
MATWVKRTIKVFNHDGFTYYPKARALVRGERSVVLQPIGNVLFNCLAEAKGKTVSDEVFLRALHAFDGQVHHHSILPMQMSKIRQALDKLVKKGGTYIINDWGVGYRLGSKHVTKSPIKVLHGPNNKQLTRRLETLNGKLLAATA